MARRKEIDKEKILDGAYKLAVKDGIESLTARNIAKAVHCSTQPIYLEFENMTDLRNQVLGRISKELKTNTLQQNFTAEPLIDLALSYIYFAKDHVGLFRAMFVDGKFGSKLISDTVITTWVSATGIAALQINQTVDFSQDQMINVLEAQVHDAMLNDRLTDTEESPLFAADDAASLAEKLS